VAGVLEWVLLCLRLGVATILLVAAAAKLAERTRTRESLREFGVPAALARPGAVLLPAAELAVAVLLVPATTARAGAAAALALLVFFSATLARAKLRGEAPDCNCFGALASLRPGAALARNALLAAAAATVAAAGAGRGLGELGTVGLLMTSFVLVSGLQAWLSWQLLRRNVGLLEQIHDLEHGHTAGGMAGRLEVGAQAPAFALPDTSGQIHTLYDLLVPGLPLALAFSDPDCAACATLPDRLARLQRTLRGELEIALITRGVAAAGSFAPTLLQDEHEVAHAYGAGHVPSAVLIAPDGAIASPLATGELAIEELLTRELLEAVS
jgi:hypothetical protein